MARKKFNRKKFEKAGWLLIEETYISPHGGPPIVSCHYKSPRMLEKARLWLDWDDADMSDAYLLETEWNHFFNEIYHLAINELAEIVRENIEENYKQLTV